jgi:hypothetical protein
MLVIGAKKLNPRTMLPDSMLSVNDARIAFYNYVLSEELFTELTRRSDGMASVLINGVFRRLSRNQVTGAATFQSTDIVNRGLQGDIESRASTTRYTLKCNSNAMNGIHLCMLTEWKRTTQ